MNAIRWLVRVHFQPHLLEPSCLPMIATERSAMVSPTPSSESEFVVTINNEERAPGVAEGISEWFAHPSDWPKESNVGVTSFSE